MDLCTTFEQTRLRSTRLCYIPNFKQLSLAVLEKKIFKYILLNPGLPWVGQFWNKFSKGPLGNAKYNVSSSELNGSMYFYGLNSGWTVLDPETSIRTNVG